MRLNACKMPLKIRSHPRNITIATDDIIGKTSASIPPNIIRTLCRRYQNECRLTFSRIASRITWEAVSTDIDDIDMVNHQIIVASPRQRFQQFDECIVNCRGGLWSNAMQSKIKRCRSKTRVSRRAFKAGSAAFKLNTGAIDRVDKDPAIDRLHKE